MAIRLPELVSHRVWLETLGGTVTLEEVRFGIVRIGFGDLGIFDQHRSRSIWDVHGTVAFKGRAKIGHGSKLNIVGAVVFGDNFSAVAESTVIAYTRISFGKNVLLSWDVLIMDSDQHPIFLQDGTICNPTKPIRVGDDVWIGCRCLLLKGTEIPATTVIAANAVVTKSFTETNTIIGGFPAAVLKRNITWRPMH